MTIGSDITDFWIRISERHLTEKTMEYKKNQILTVTIEDIGNDGEGIGRCDGYILFVKDAVCGDTVKARLTKVKKNYAYARLEEIVVPSPDRVREKCENHRRCGG